MSIVIKPVIVGDILSNCYVAFDSESLDGIVIDPGDDFAKIMAVIEKNKVKIAHIVATHGHFDHIGAVNELKKKTGADFIIHEEDVIFAEYPAANGSALYGDGTVKAKADKFVKDGDIIKAGKLEFKVIHTPGHTPGGICLLTCGHLFSGDTLFLGSIGRTDFPNADHDDMMKSLAKLMKLPDDVKVYPGHGSYTTIGEERQNNPFIKI